VKKPDAFSDDILYDGKKGITKEVNERSVDAEN
jgi:hypothetical protein